MEKLLLTREEIYKAIKSYKFHIEEKSFQKNIKNITPDTIIFEKVEAKLQIGIINGIMQAKGVKENVSNPDFVTVLDQCFHTEEFPLLINGNEYAAWSYAIKNGILEKVENDYPFNKAKLKDAAIKLGSKYFESYFEKLGLVMRNTDVLEYSFDAKSSPIEHKIWLIKIPTLGKNNFIVIGYIDSFLNDENKQKINFIY